jgi:type II secretory pathway pseudopilin PulG
VEDPGTYRPLVVGLVLVGVLIVAVAILSLYGSQSNEAQTAQQTANAEQPAQTASAPAAQEQPADQAPDTEEVKKVEATQRRFRSLPDPQPPVALNKIEGIWWAEDDTARNKVFAFVEQLNLSASPYKAELSTSDGTKFTVECTSEFPVMSSSVTDPDYHEGRCGTLPLFTWIRVAMSGVITDPEAESWGLTYRESDDNPLQSNFRVTAICYPSGTCTTIEEAGTRAWEKMREKARRGDN